MGAPANRRPSREESPRSLRGFFSATSRRRDTSWPSFGDTFTAKKRRTSALPKDGKPWICWIFLYRSIFRDPVKPVNIQRVALTCCIARAMDGHVGLPRLVFFKNRLLQMHCQSVGTSFRPSGPNQTNPSHPVQPLGDAMQNTVRRHIPHIRSACARSLVVRCSRSHGWSCEAAHGGLEAAKPQKRDGRKVSQTTRRLKLRRLSHTRCSRAPEFLYQYLWIHRVLTTSLLFLGFVSATWMAKISDYKNICLNVAYTSFQGVTKPAVT